jgi:hypothetical protein
VFADRSTLPDDAALASHLGKSKRAWDAILDHVQDRCAGVALDWKFYGQKHGWQLKLIHGKRSVLYLIPHEGRFTAAIALRPAAIASLSAHGVPAALISAIEAAAPSSEGSPARIDVTGVKQVAIVQALLAAKLAT